MMFDVLLNQWVYENCSKSDFIISIVEENNSYISYIKL